MGSEMKKQIVKVPSVAHSGSFNHVVKVNGFLFLTSQLSADLATGKILSGNITEQTTRAMENVKFLLESCGSKMEDIVKVVIYMRDAKDREKMNQVYQKYFMCGEEPAKVSVQAASPIDGVDIEIEVVAVAR